VTAEVSHAAQAAAEPTIEERLALAEERLAEHDRLIADLLVCATDGQPSVILRSLGASQAGARLLEHYRKIRGNVNSYPDAH
jgi:hypothetical protein